MRVTTTFDVGCWEKCVASTARAGKERTLRTCSCRCAPSSGGRSRPPRGPPPRSRPAFVSFATENNKITLSSSRAGSTTIRHSVEKALESRGVSSRSAPRVQRPHRAGSCVFWDHLFVQKPRGSAAPRGASRGAAVLAEPWRTLPDSSTAVAARAAGLWETAVRSEETPIPGSRPKVKANCLRFRAPGSPSTPRSRR